MNKKLFLPLAIFLTLSIALMVQLFRNGNGDDPKKLESALVGKPVPTFKLESVVNEAQMLDENVVKTGHSSPLKRVGDLVSNLLRGTRLFNRTG